MDVVGQILLAARRIVSTPAEKEVEKLILAWIGNTPFKNKAFIVGGYTRDEFMGLEAKDLDVVVDMKDGAMRMTASLKSSFPEQITNPRMMGAGYPIWQITFKDDVEFNGVLYGTKGAVIEFADAQKESFPDPESRQRVVEHGTLEEDIERRDFTVNMLLKSLTTGEVVDLTGTSANDIRNGILRGHPGVDFDKILRDDPLRMIRLIRFQAKYGWSVPMSVLRAVRRNASRIAIVSGERVRDELIKVMNLGKLAQAIKMMKAVGLLQYVMPEIQAMQGVEHEYSKGVHQEGDVFRHTLKVLQSAKPGVESQLAALLHDVGKPSSQEVLDGLIRFIGHEKVSGEIAEAMMRRLKMDASTISRVRTIVENHMRPHALARDSGPTGLRRFIREVGDELVDAVLDLAEADQLGNLPPKNTIPGLRTKIEEIRIPVKKSDILPIDGRDVQRVLGIKPGPDVGKALSFLRDKKFEMEQAGKEMSKADAEALLREFGKM